MTQNTKIEYQDCFQRCRRTRYACDNDKKGDKPGLKYQLGTQRGVYLSELN